MGVFFGDPMGIFVGLLWGSFLGALWGSFLEALWGRLSCGPPSSCRDLRATRLGGCRVTRGFYGGSYRGLLGVLWGHFHHHGGIHIWGSFGRSFWGSYGGLCGGPVGVLAMWPAVIMQGSMRNQVGELGGNKGVLWVSYKGLFGGLLGGPLGVFMGVLWEFLWGCSLCSPPSSCRVWHATRLGGCGATRGSLWGSFFKGVLWWSFWGSYRRVLWGSFWGSLWGSYGGTHHAACHHHAGIHAQPGWGAAG